MNNTMLEHINTLNWGIVCMCVAWFLLIIVRLNEKLGFRCKVCKCKHPLKDFRSDEIDGLKCPECGALI